MSDSLNRRPLQTRRQAWPRALAHFCVGLGISPNQMSVASVGCALLGAATYWGSAVTGFPWRPAFLAGAAILVQLRLLANMLDGLMAVEEGRKTPTGVIYNELPDRVADTVFLVAAGYAGGAPALGWAAAVLAVATAYLRTFGGSLGFAQDFSGPMAKQHRMFVLTVGSLLAACLPAEPVLAVALGVIVLGCGVTLFRRTRRLASQLRAREHD
jgi:phosphatidylglycerophosphate synthase